MNVMDLTVGYRRRAVTPVTFSAMYRLLRPTFCNKISHKFHGLETFGNNRSQMIG